MAEGQTHVSCMSFCLSCIIFSGICFFGTKVKAKKGTFTIFRNSSYAWFFTLERHAAWMAYNKDEDGIPERMMRVGGTNESHEQNNKGERTTMQQRDAFSSTSTSSGTLTLRQRAMNATHTALVPIQPFGRVNGTAVWIDLIEVVPTAKCQQFCAPPTTI